MPTWAVRSELADATDRSLELGYAHLPVIRGGELVVFTRAARPRRYVAVRTVAAYALSIVGDHCDVTATRPTGGQCRPPGRWHKAYNLALVACARLRAAWRR